MSLKYAILGILNVIPMTGYDLKTQVFDISVQHFWPADQAQIYRTLNKLAEQGWVEAHLEPQESRPDRKVYTITEEGRAALDAWLRDYHPSMTIRDAFLVQLFFAEDLPNEELLGVIDRQIAEHEAHQAALQAIPIPPRESQPDNRRLALQHLTLDYGLALEEMTLRWLADCHATIEELPEPQAGAAT
jgi:PadR family transcriptional regulator AphA